MTSNATGASKPQQIIPVKCVMIGPSFAGKTSLVVRLVKDTFHNEQAATVGAMFLNKFFNFDKYVIKFELWDTAGQEKFHSLAPMYFRGAKIAVVVFDISNIESFNKAKSWTREFKSHSTEQAIMVLVGNKCDLDRAIPVDVAEQYAREEDMIYFEASAKDNTNVNNIFQILAEKIPPPSNEPTGKDDHVVSVARSKEKEKKKCC
ncbi:hypothetical protein SAMD00019534_041810 [Acytostelium subglobosum LB1]|uniref:hypothetical protein n=1 Tax=Acytostelium subglobosum LB1 TaxID=1410327 RepID=UPI0006450D17|nr:hypothetical protein SAMD00019534_041810 [Acytostelium subglobosum LB1]GAM21006.1 hypothetical protein SAMD00019534_041810 [Acytostelium subglobosum LB1]|eukprot:XP_012756140.1 hypothetical protein SAMD00019534_041810 [Acytostelium subglobosum LB1]